MKKSFIEFLFISLFLVQAPAAEQKPIPDLDVPFVRTPIRVVEEMLRVAEVNGDDVLYDLGCGDGRIVITAAGNTGAFGVGIDMDPERIKESRENAVKAKVEDLTEFVEQDFFQADVGRATVVTLYVLTKVNLRLRPKLLRQLRPGARIVSHNYGMGEWEPDLSTVVTGEFDTHTVYLWVVPANVAGTWEWTLPTGTGEERYVLELNQHFQRVQGSILSGLSKVSVRDIELEGDRIRFDLERMVKDGIVPMHFECLVNANIIEGTVESRVESGRVKSAWKARRAPSTVNPLSNSDRDLNKSFTELIDGQ